MEPTSARCGTPHTPSLSRPVVGLLYSGYPATLSSQLGRLGRLDLYVDDRRRDQCNPGAAFRRAGVASNAFLTPGCATFPSSIAAIQPVTWAAWMIRNAPPGPGCSWPGCRSTTHLGPPRRKEGLHDARDSAACMSNGPRPGGRRSISRAAISTVRPRRPARRRDAVDVAGRARRATGPCISHRRPLRVPADAARPPITSREPTSSPARRCSSHPATRSSSSNRSTTRCRPPPACSAVRRHVKRRSRTGTNVDGDRVAAAPHRQPA